MDQHLTLDLNSNPAATVDDLVVGIGSVSQKREMQAPEPLRFPAEDGGRSLAEAARLNLDAALQLLADRAQYITGASGAAIALREGEKMTCRASAGASAPAIGANLDVNAGLSGECVRSRMLLRCDDAENDARVSRESCRALGIASVLVLPLLQGESVIGLFELLSEKANAFRDRDITALERLGEMVHTALENAHLETRTLGSSVSPIQTAPALLALAGQKQQSATIPAKEPTAVAVIDAVVPDTVATKILSERGNVRSCEACGFPVSGRRRFCLDCELSQGSGGYVAGQGAESAFLTNLEAAGRPQQSWFRANQYVLGTLLMAILSLLAVLFLR